MRSPETFVHIQTTQQHIPKYGNVHNIIPIVIFVYVLHYQNPLHFDAPIAYHKTYLKFKRIFRILYEM
jgi:hypothetical protein